MRKPTRALFALTATVSLTAAACGSDSNDAEPAETAAPAPAEEAMEEEAMEEGGPTGPLCSAVPEDGEGSFAGMTDDPAGTAASNNPALSTLVAAVVEADLVDTLNSDGPFTIFAPANPAFEAFTEDELNGLLADTDALTNVLTYHVVAGEKLASTDLVGMDSVTTVQGTDISLAVNGDALTLNGDQATVGCADVQTANAVVHILDGVLMPAADDAMEEDAMEDEAMEEDAMEEDAMEDEAMEEDAMEEAAGPTGPLCVAVPEEGEGSFAGMTDDPAGTAASNNPALSTLVAAVVEAGLVDTLNSDGPFTIFAPANPAFEAFTEDELNGLLADTDALTNVLTYHVVAGEKLSSTDLAGMDSVETIAGTVTLAVDGDSLALNGDQATVGCADVQTANAVVHIIDGVLMPAS